MLSYTVYQKQVLVVPMAACVTTRTHTIENGGLTSNAYSTLNFVIKCLRSVYVFSTVLAKIRCWSAPSFPVQEEVTYFVRTSSSLSSSSSYTTPVSYLRNPYTLREFPWRERDSHISPRLRVRSGFTMASMVALDDANALGQSLAHPRRMPRTSRGVVHERFIYDTGVVYLVQEIAMPASYLALITDCENER